MGNANIDDALKNDIEKLLKTQKYKIGRYRDLKGFIDCACSKLLQEIKDGKKKT